MRPIDGFYLPPSLAAGVETAVQRFGPAHDAIEIRLPIVSAEDVTRWIGTLRAARAQHLAERPIASILRPLERVVARYLDPRSQVRRTLVQCLATCGRFSAPMIERALDDAFEPLARGGFRKWIASELGAVSALDEPAPTREGVLRRATGPEWMLQIYAGNVPTVPVWPLLSALLLKSALLAKTSAQEPLLAPLLARTIAEEDADLGACIAVVWWKGGTAELERAALASAPAVLAFGGETAMASITRQIRPDARVVIHGPKVSLAYVGRGALSRAALAGLARQVAEDVALYDQQGCLSPHAVYVERGAAVTPVDFAAALGEALEAASITLPRRQPTASEAASIQLYRTQARFEASGDPRNRALSSGSGTSWTVVCESGARFEPGPAHRVVRVHSIAGPEEFERAVGPSLRHVEALAVEERGPRRAVLAARFAGLGIPRIAPAGALQRPSPLGTHGGVRRLAPFVTWSTVERGKSAAREPSARRAPTPRAPRAATRRAPRAKKASRPSRKGSGTKGRPRRRSR